MTTLLSQAYIYVRLIPWSVNWVRFLLMRFPFLKMLPLASIALSSAPVLAEDAQSEAVKAVIHHHVEGINSGNLSKMTADWTAEGAVVDAFPPYLWQGKAPIERWWTDLQAAIKPAGLNKVQISADKWQRVDVRGDLAYAVADATALISGPTLTLRAQGAMTFVLNRQDGVWRISSWNWGGPQAAPVIPK